MSEALAAGALAPSAGGMRPRVSAASFRDLTARLKRTGTAQQPPVEAGPQVFPAEVVQPASCAPAPPLPHVPDLDPPTSPAAWAIPETRLADFAVAHPPGQLADPAPVVELDLPKPLTEEATAEQLQSGQQPSTLQGELQSSDFPGGMEPAAAAIDAAPPAQATDEPPAAGHGPAIPAQDAADAARQEALSRQEALQLSVIWRSLLANPTMEERAQFLREAAELMAAEGDTIPPPAPEHDLSRVAPASLPQEVEPQLEVAEPQLMAPPVSTAADASRESVDLVRSLLDMMAAGSSSGLPHERALAADTLLRMLPKLDVKPVIMMAQRLAKADNPPQMLVAKLIRDPRVEVAGPLLEDCPQISDRDLETVVAEGNPAKLRMLARRRHLTTAISDALIATENGSVLLTLVRNGEAQISQDGFVNLIRLAERDKELLAPLSTRADLPAPLAFELFWLAPPQLRRFILSRFLTDSETLSKILKITLTTDELDAYTDQEASHQHVLVEALERAARGKLDVAAEELAGILNVAPATVLRALNDPEGEPLIILLKVAGFPRQSLSGVLHRFRDADLPILSSDRDLSELQTIYDTLSFNKARILLTYWDWSQRKIGPYAPLH